MATNTAEALLPHDTRSHTSRQWAAAAPISPYMVEGRLPDRNRPSHSPDRLSQPIDSTDQNYRHFRSIDQILRPCVAANSLCPVLVVTIVMPSTLTIGRPEPTGSQCELPPPMECRTPKSVETIDIVGVRVEGDAGDWLVAETVTQVRPRRRACLGL